MDSTSTVNVKVNTPQEGFWNKNVHLVIITTSGTLISVFLILRIIWEKCRYWRLTGLSTINGTSYEMHEVNDIYTEIDEAMVKVAFLEDSEITGSKECINNGHVPPFTEMEEDRCEENVYSTVCKKYTLSNDEAKDDEKTDMTPTTIIAFEMGDG